MSFLNTLRNLFFIASVSATGLHASASLQNYTGATCGAGGSSVTVQFEIRAAAWQQAFYAVGFSSNTAPDAGDTWVSGNCGSGTGAPSENAVPVWHTITISVTVPAAWPGGYLLVLGHENFMTCAGAQAVIPITFPNACGTPTPTVTPTRTPMPTATRTPTPTLPLVKSANVATASVGQTLTYCVAWTNDSSGAITRTFYDLLDTHLTWVSGDAGCSAAGQLVTCSFAAAAGASGSKCFAVFVNSSP